MDQSYEAHPPDIVEGTSPCQGCAAACCWQMKLTRLEAHSWSDLAYIDFLTCFPEIEVLAMARGHFRVFYRTACRHLDTTSADGDYLCRLHDTPDKPRVCVEYDEHGCFYRTAFLGGRRSDAVRLDRRRWAAIAPLYATSADGDILRLPDPPAMWEAIDELAPDPAPQSSVPVTTDADLHTEVRELYPFGDRTSPCDGCAAPCCMSLFFDRPAPRHRRDLEFMHYQLGFPGVRIAVSAGGWRTILRTTCANLDVATRRCTVFGKPERPAMCTQYNEHVCTYREFFADDAQVVWIDSAQMQRMIQRLPSPETGRLPEILSSGTLLAAMAE